MRANFASIEFTSFCDVVQEIAFVVSRLIIGIGSRILILWYVEWPKF